MDGWCTGGMHEKRQFIKYFKSEGFVWLSMAPKIAF